MKQFRFEKTTADWKAYKYRVFHRAIECAIIGAAGAAFAAMIILLAIWGEP